MITLFVVFVVFAIATPIALEERHHRGDNIVKRMGREITESEQARRLFQRIGKAKRSTSTAIAAIVFGISAIILVIGVLREIVKAIFGG